MNGQLSQEQLKRPRTSPGILEARAARAKHDSLQFTHCCPLAAPGQSPPAARLREQRGSVSLPAPKRAQRPWSSRSTLGQQKLWEQRRRRQHAQRHGPAQVTAARARPMQPHFAGVGAVSGAGAGAVVAAAAGPSAGAKAGAAAAGSAGGWMAETKPYSLGRRGSTR